VLIEQLNNSLYPSWTFLGLSAGWAELGSADFAYAVFFTRYRRKII